MKKFLSFTICIFALLGVFLTPNLTANSVSAETIVTSKLEYFELDKPVTVDRDGDRVFIGQKDLIVIYHDETYDKIEILNGEISHLEKCGNHLLFLNGDKLFSLNLATYEISAPLFEGVDSFSVNGLLFAINRGSLVDFFEVSDAENFLFSQVKPSYQPDFSVSILQSSNAIALMPDLTFYYYALSHVKDYDENGRQGNTFDQTIDGLTQFCHSDDLLFFKTNEKIFSYSLTTDELLTVANLEELGLLGEGGFCVDQNSVLICDTQNDKVVEFDLSTSSLTGFEISFTKINLPDDFNLDFNDAPQFITVEKGDRLYDINLELSIQNKYFLFNGYHNQEVRQEYLLVREIQNSFYLIAGDCFALVLKEDYTPSPITLMGSELLKGFLTNDAKCYNFPMLESNFASFEIKKHSSVDILSKLTFNGIDYFIVSQEGHSGFIPATFILSEIYRPEDYHDYRTATTVKKSVSVFSDPALTSEVAKLEGFSSIVIIEELDNTYYISYNQGQSVGYIAKNSVSTKGKYTNRNVAIAVLVAFSFTVTGIYLMLKYLYRRKKKL